MSKTQTLSFYTLGPEFTKMIRDFIKEGSFHQAYEILKDGGAPEEYIKSFFLFTAEFVGDTRDDSFAIRFCEPLFETEEKLTAQYYYAIRTLMTQAKQDDDEDIISTEIEMDIPGLKRSKNKHYQALLKVFSEKQVLGWILPNSDLKKDYKLNPAPEDDKIFDGVIVPDGTFIECGFQEHRELYPILFRMGLSDASDWTDSENTFHISSGEIVGGCAHGLSHRKYQGDRLPTQNQLDTLFKYRNCLRTHDRDNDSITKALLEYESDGQEHGGKYNNLYFLRKYYSDLITLPKFSKEPLGLENECIRTSPKYSMPGLLNSKFEITENSIKEIEEDFAKYGDNFGMPDNEHYKNRLHYFYQEYLKGVNGVAHFRNDKFSYSASESQGDIVQGKGTSVSITYEIGCELEGICRMLSKDLDENIQVEFVISDNVLYIVQLRILKREPKNERTYPEEEILYKGKSFSVGYIEYGKWTPKKTEFKLDEVLIIDDDAHDSSLLLGKEALIVRKDIEFSHMLALSKALGIPSIYAVGEVDLPEEFRIDTLGEEGYILKIKGDGK